MKVLTVFFISTVLLLLLSCSTANTDDQYLKKNNATLSKSLPKIKYESALKE